MCRRVADGIHAPCSGGFLRFMRPTAVFGIKDSPAPIINSGTAINVFETRINDSDPANVNSLP